MNKNEFTNIVLGKDKSFIKANIKELKKADFSYYVVKAGDERRLDIISGNIYNTVDLKWLLLYINEISDMSDVYVGRILKYCSYADYISVVLRVMEIS